MVESHRLQASCTHSWIRMRIFNICHRSVRLCSSNSLDTPMVLSIRTRHIKLIFSAYSSFILKSELNRMNKSLIFSHTTGRDLKRGDRHLGEQGYQLIKSDWSLDPPTARWLAVWWVREWGNESATLRHAIVLCWY